MCESKVGANEQRTNANTKFMFVMALLDCYVTADSLM